MTSQTTRRGMMLGILAAAALLAGCAGMGESKPAKERVVIQVSDGNPGTWNLALNVIENLNASYAKRQAASEIVLVAFGPGLPMLRDDAVVASRVRDAMKSGAQMVACENTMRRSKVTKDLMLDKIAYVEAGVIHIIEKQQQGWSVVRP